MRRIRTDIVILEPGGNDRRFLVPAQWRAANIAEMERRLKARSISVIVYDEVMPLQYRDLDFIHFTQQRHDIINAVKWYRTESDTQLRHDVVQHSPPMRG